MSSPPAYSVHDVSVSESGDTYDLRRLLTEDWAMSGFKSGGSLLWHRDGARCTFDNTYIQMAIDQLRYLHSLVEGGRIPEIPARAYLIDWTDGLCVPTISQVMLSLQRNRPRP